MTMLRLQQNVLSHCYNFVIKMLKLKKIKKMMDKKHCFTPGLTKVIILLVICDISFCYNFVMKMFVIWPCFLVNTFKTSHLKSLTTSSRVPHYLVQVPRKCIQCYWCDDERWTAGDLYLSPKLVIGICLCNMAVEIHPLTFKQFCSDAPSHWIRIS